MLMPVAILIMFVLGAITVDDAAVRAGLGSQHCGRARLRLRHAAGLDEAAVRDGDGYRIDPIRAWFVTLDALATKGILDDLDGAPDVAVDAGGTVTVSLSRRIPHLFARAIPGAPDDQLVRATATAVVEQR